MSIKAVSPADGAGRENVPRVLLTQRESNTLESQGDPNRSHEKQKQKPTGYLASDWGKHANPRGRAEPPALRCRHPQAALGFLPIPTLWAASGCLGQLVKPIVGVKNCLLCGHSVP